MAFDYAGWVEMAKTEAEKCLARDNIFLGQGYDSTATYRTMVKVFVEVYDGPIDDVIVADQMAKGIRLLVHQAKLLAELYPPQDLSWRHYYHAGHPIARKRIYVFELEVKTKEAM